jgi:hypothetical protein
MEKSFNIRESCRIHLEFSAKQFRNDISCPIIAGRPKAAGCNNEVGPLQRLIHSRYNGRARVVNGKLSSHQIPMIRQLPAKPLLVSIKDPADHQFCAGINDFDVHFQGGRGVLRKFEL